MTDDDDIFWLGWILLDCDTAHKALEETNGKLFNLWGNHLIRYKNNQLIVTETGMALLNKESNHGQN